MSKKISVVHLLSILPDEELNAIAKKTSVNYYSKILDGRSMLCLILYSLIECQRNSLRTMEDIFNSATFKFLFNLDADKTVKYNSISERLSVINVDFFKLSYELIYKRFSEYYNENEREKLNLISVDSTMVAEAANKLKKGMNIGKKKDGKKQIKYTVAFDGDFPCSSEIFTDREYLSEDKTIPKVVYKYAKANTSSVFVFDRGVTKREVYCKLSEQGSGFVTRINEWSRFKEIRTIEEGSDKLIGTLKLLKDKEIRLGKPNARTYLDEPFRLIQAEDEKTKTKYWFLTNLFAPEVNEILAIYKKRWKIEVFFRFLKQELNLNHITSTSENGMKVMMYMTLIASMLILMYKKLNQVGYKTAVRRISFELNEFIIKLIVQHSGGDPGIVFR